MLGKSGGMSERADSAVDDREACFRVGVLSGWRGLPGFAELCQSSYEQWVGFGQPGRFGRFHAYTTRVYFHFSFHSITGDVMTFP